MAIAHQFEYVKPPALREAVRILARYGMRTRALAGGTDLVSLINDLKGKLLNANFTDYKIPIAEDLLDEIVPIIIEVAQPDGPYGARGVGEHTMIPAAAMVANAVEDAVGLRVKRLPITAEKVALELHGIRYDDVKGAYRGLCFAGQPEFYGFHPAHAKKK